MCDPSPSADVVNGEVHDTNADESSEHSKAEVSLAVKENIATEFDDGFVGVELKFVSGAAVSTIQV